MLAQFCAVAVLAAPLALIGASNETITQALKLTKYVEPQFPASMRIEGIPSGAVTLVISPGESGTPKDILVLASTDARLSEAAIEAARQWRFIPGPVPTDNAAAVVSIGFRLGGIVYVYPFGQDFTGKDIDPGVPVKTPSLQALPQSPKALHQPMPVYPAAMEARAVEGSAAVRFYVDENGHVRIPQVVNATSPEFAVAALAAVEKWRYEPPQMDGRRIVASDCWSFKFAATN